MMDPLLRAIDRINRWFFAGAALLCLLLVLLTAEQVVARYFFGESSMAMQELEWHFFGLIFLLAAPYTFRLEGHVRVDIFYGRMSPKTRRLIDAGGILLFLLPVCFVLVHSGMEFVLEARSFQGSGAYKGTVLGFLLQGEGSADPGGLPARWLIKAAIPLAGFLLGLQGLAGLLRLLSGRPLAPPVDGEGGGDDA